MCVHFFISSLDLSLYFFSFFDLALFLPPQPEIWTSMNFPADIGVQEIELETLAENRDQSSTQVGSIFIC